MKLIRLFTAAALALSLCASCQKGGSVSSGVLFEDVVASRRSIRSYDASKTISEAQVRELITAAQQAPSWANMQPSKYYVAISPEKLQAVSEVIGESNRRNVAGAPVLIVSAYENGKSGFFRGEQTNELGDAWGAFDNGLSSAYLVLNARAMGFDTLIMGMRDSDALRAIFGIPSDETVTAVIALGYRAADPAAPSHRDLDEIVKFY